jgi:hypothetical protein
VATPTRRRLTPSGYPLQKAEREKLNDERGIKPLPVSRSRDGAEPGNAGSGWVEGRFCILALEISAPLRGAGNCGGAGASHMPDRSGRPGVLPT